MAARAMDLTRLVVSELVTYARKYAPGPVMMELRVSRSVVEVAVWDSGPVLPVPGPPMRAVWDSTAWRSSWPSPRGSRSGGGIVGSMRILDRDIDVPGLFDSGEEFEDLQGVATVSEEIGVRGDGVGVQHLRPQRDQFLAHPFVGGVV
ncbi:hypothetical protein GCM10010372_51010 [Streptomyces tauricus]|nr:hypothetical protein GCM10010372_51010 [Streptomyces tauricus]